MKISRNRITQVNILQRYSQSLFRLSNKWHYLPVVLVAVFSINLICVTSCLANNHHQSFNTKANNQYQHCPAHQNSNQESSSNNQNQNDPQPCEACLQKTIQIEATNLLLPVIVQSQIVLNQHKFNLQPPQFSKFYAHNIPVFNSYQIPLFLRLRTLLI